MRVVLNSLRDEINRRLDLALAECPDAAPDRELFYAALLEAFDNTGEIPEFSLVKNEAK